MNRFLEFLYDEETSDIDQLRGDLDALGVDVSRVQTEVRSVLARAERASKLGWIDRAREKQAAFESLAKEQAGELSLRFKTTRELIDALFSGSLGFELQQRAQVFFRNKRPRDVSDEDLRTFIEDCELLRKL